MGPFQLFYYFILCLFLTACGFDRLTAINAQDVLAPTAEECGSCHVEQYSEWQQTAHARAFVSSEFKSQSDDYQDVDCLFCHVPAEVLDPARKVRRYNRSEGVTCVSCHLHKESMHGPHESGALFSPHSIAQDSIVDSKLDSSKLCGVCHEETYEQWQTQRAIKDYPTCHGCHGASVERPDTKGTNFFSDFLVFFEPVYNVRSHYLMMPDKLATGVGPELQLDTLTADTVSFTLLNNLPHDLPTGSFGEKDLFFMLSWQQEDDTVMEQTREVITTVLSPGQSHFYSVSLPEREEGQELHIDLFRSHQSTGKITLIGSYLFPFAILN